MRKGIGHTYLSPETDYDRESRYDERIVSAEQIVAPLFGKIFL